MHYLTSFLLCFCGVILASSIKPVPFKFQPLKGNEANSKLGITGGTKTSIKKHPYQAVVKTPKDIGSGAIISKKFILTSAYLIKFYPQYLEVRVSTDNFNQSGQLIAVKKAIIHEKFDGYYSYDVALLKLSKPIKFGKNAKPIKLASKPGKNGTTAVVSGYGEASFLNGGDNEGNLSEGKQSVIERNSCQTYYAGLALDESHTCAYSPTVCACINDYGDPLVQNKKLLGYYIGGSYCCYTDIPQVYTNVPTIYQWVKDHMKKEGYDLDEENDHYF